MGLLEDLNSGKYNLILFAIIFAFIFHQYWPGSKIENMADSSNEILEAVKQAYDVDVEAIRNLSELAKKLNSKEGVTIPGNVTISGQLTVGSKDMEDGKITLVNKKGEVGNTISHDSTLFIVKGMIVAWAGTTPPAGWALCDGQAGTPDLRGRFVLGAMVGDNKDNKYINTAVKAPTSDYWGYGGEQFITLKPENLPAHSHRLFADNDQVVAHDRSFKGESGKDRTIRLKAGISGLKEVTTDSFGGGKKGVLGSTQPQEFNNVPPYWVLAYIMKL
jgi:microcystin-dependent protein